MHPSRMTKDLMSLVLKQDGFSDKASMPQSCSGCLQFCQISKQDLMFPVCHKDTIESAFFQVSNMSKLSMMMDRSWRSRCCFGMFYKSSGYRVTGLLFPVCHKNAAESRCLIFKNGKVPDDDGYVFDSPTFFQDYAEAQRHVRGWMPLSLACRTPATSIPHLNPI